MTHYRYKPDPTDPNKTVDLYKQELAKTKEAQWAVAIELARIADALEPDDNCENFFTQVETIKEAIREGSENICKNIDMLDTKLG